MPEDDRPTRRKLPVRKIVALLVVLAGLSGGTAWALRAFDGQAAVGPDLPTAAVTRGPLIVTVTESGEIEAEKSKLIRNELSWKALIKEVVDNGTRVSKGDKIIEFECEQLEEALRKQELAFTDANTGFIRAQRNLELKREEVQRKLDRAKEKVTDANSDMLRYMQADWPIKLRDAQGDIEIAQRNLAVAQDQLELKLRVNEDPVLKGLYSEKVIESYRFDVKKQKLALQKAEAKLAMLKEFDHPREQRRLTNAIKDAELDYRRAELEARNEIDKAEANLQSARLNMERKGERLTELREQQENLIVKAEQEGLVVYRTGGRRRGNDVEVKVGEEIRPMQQLMIIPDLDTLQVETKVFEAMYKYLDKGAQARIRLDTEPDVVHPGKVSWVAPLANRAHWFNPGVKVFDVKVEFDEIPADLKPNMTARVEIVLAELDDVLSVPLAAVFTENDTTFCWRVGPGGREKIEVEVGHSNDRRVEVTGGLSAGDRVLLVEPEQEQSPTTTPTSTPTVAGGLGS